MFAVRLGGCRALCGGGGWFQKAGDFEAFADFGGDGFCLADGVHDAFGELDAREAVAQGPVDVGEVDA